MKKKTLVQRLKREEEPPHVAQARKNVCSYFEKCKEERKREADLVDGYDRDDLGLSPDY